MFARPVVRASFPSLFLCRTLTNRTIADAQRTGGIGRREAHELGRCGTIQREAITAYVDIRPNRERSGSRVYYLFGSALDRLSLCQ